MIGVGITQTGLALLWMSQRPRTQAHSAEYAFLSLDLGGFCCFLEWRNIQVLLAQFVFCRSFPLVDFHPLIITMVNHDQARVMLMFFGLFTFLAAITLNAMSGFGKKSGECLVQLKFRLDSERYRTNNQMCLLWFRYFPAHHRGCDTQVFHTFNSCRLGSVCLGFHIFLGSCHVYILYSGTLQKVGLCTRVVYHFANEDNA